MTEILTIDVDVEWVDGLDEPSGLIWIGDRWSIADKMLGTAVKSSHGVCCLDAQSCSTMRNEFDLQRFFNIGEAGPVAAFAQRAHSGHPIDFVAP